MASNRAGETTLDFRLEILCTNLATEKCRELEYAYISRQRADYNRRQFERRLRPVVTLESLPTTTTQAPTTTTTLSVYEIYKKRYEIEKARYEEQLKKRHEEHRRREEHHRRELERRRQEEQRRMDEYHRALDKHKSDTDRDSSVEYFNTGPLWIKTRFDIVQSDDRPLRRMRVRSLRRHRRRHLRCRLEWVDKR